jgi:uncharacterized protein (TIGR03085 family)
MSLASTERAALADDLDKLGPAAPTLCEGWLADDLLCHLLIRENDPIGALTGRAEVFDEIEARRLERLVRSGSFTDRVQRFRTGPDRLSVFRIPGVDRAANGAEYFIHHEDLLRAQPDWAPRAVGRQTQAHLATTLKRMGKLLVRRSPVGVRAELTDQTGPLHRLWLHSGNRIVTLVGLPSEVLLYCFGRTDAAQVEILGEPETVEAFRSADLSV